MQPTLLCHLGAACCPCLCLLPQHLFNSEIQCILIYTYKRCPLQWTKSGKARQRIQSFPTIRKAEACGHCLHCLRPSMKQACITRRAQMSQAMHTTAAAAAPEIPRQQMVQESIAQ